MSKVIWKFPVRITDHQLVSMPSGANLLHVAMQGDSCCLWAMVDPQQEPCQRELCIYGTGHPMPDDPGRYIGTFMLHDGALVFHAFDPS